MTVVAQYRTGVYYTDPAGPPNDQKVFEEEQKADSQERLPLR